MDFQTAARQRGSPLSKTSSHVYTRDGFSGTRPASRGLEGSPLSENSSRVYTRDAVSCTGRLPSASDRSRSELRRPRRRISELRMGRAAHLPGKQSLRVCRSLDSLLGVLPYGELYRGVDTSAIVPLAANSRRAHFRLASAAAATRRHRVTPADSPSSLQPWQQTLEVSAHIGRQLPSVVRGTAGRNSPHECSRARVAAMVRASTSSQLGGALPAASGPHPNSFAPGETSGRSPPLPAAHQSTLFSGLTSVHERCGQGSTFSLADRSCLP